MVCRLARTKSAFIVLSTGYKVSLILSKPYAFLVYSIFRLIYSFSLVNSFGFTVIRCKALGHNPVNISAEAAQKRIPPIKNLFRPKYELTKNNTDTKSAITIIIIKPGNLAFISA